MTSFDIDLFVIRGRSGGARGSDRSDKATDKVVGVHIMGHDAGEMIQLAAIAITMGATKVDFDRVVAVHPTAAEELVTMGTPVVVKKPVTVEQFSLVGAPCGTRPESTRGGLHDLDDQPQLQPYPRR